MVNKDFHLVRRE